MDIIKTTIKTHIVDNLINYVANKVSQEFAKKVNANIKIISENGFIVVGVKKYDNFEYDIVSNVPSNQYFYIPIMETTLPHNHILLEPTDIYIEPMPYTTHKMMCKLIYEKYYENR